MLGGCVVHHCVPGDVAHQHWLVIHEVLSQTCVGPAIEEILQIGDLWPIIWEGDQDGQLDVIREVAPWLDLSKSVVKGSGLGDIPQGVDEVVGITFHVEVMSFPEWLKSWKLLDVDGLRELQGFLHSLFEVSPWLGIGFLQ